jgi:hypothetical protein
VFFAGGKNEDLGTAWGWVCFLIGCQLGDALSGAVGRINSGSSKLLPGMCRRKAII